MHQRTRRTDPEVDPPPWSAHSIQWNYFQDHPDLHGRHPFEINDFVKKTFHSISRSKLVASISNETDPDGKTKILTILNIKLPHQNGIDNVRVKVDDGAEANILPLDSFRTMFPHALGQTRLPTRWNPEKIQDKTWMLWWWKADKSWQYQTGTSALLG